MNSPQTRNETVDDSAGVPLPDVVLEIDGLQQKLFDAERREAFTVRVNCPLKIACRSLVALLGPSGCGKTTLLTVLGLLRSPSHPESLGRFIMRTPNRDGSWVEHDLRSIWQRGTRRSVEQLRREHVGFALQSGELLPALTVRENIATPLMLNGWNGASCRVRVDELLNSFGLNHPRERRERKDGWIIRESTSCQAVNTSEWPWREPLCIGRQFFMSMSRPAH